MSKYRYHYYTIEVPADGGWTSEERAQLAIDWARESARLYVLPAEWRVLADDGQMVKICRKSHKPTHPAA